MNVPKPHKRAGRPADERPYIRDAGRAFEGPADFATVTTLMVLLALATGFAVGFLVFLVMNLSGWLTTALWSGYVDGGQISAFPLLVCTLGGVVIGLWTRLSGSKVASLEQVMSTFRATGSYHVGAAKGTVSFLLPLVFGGSVGFEAGLTGLITSGCCWIRDKLKAAGLREAAVADVTIAASLSAVFGTPLAGVVAGAESSPQHAGDALAEPSVDDYTMRRSTKIVLYTAAAFGAFAGIKLFSGIFGVSSGFPHFGAVAAQGADFVWALPALVLAYVLTLAYHASSTLSQHAAGLLDGFAWGDVAKPVAAGVVLGALAIAFPYVLFSGEEQSHMLMETWSAWTAVALMATGVLKACATPLCINLGWMGGNFCPSIFAGAACGYGLSMLTGADPVLMVTVTVSGFLAGVVRKPLLTIAVVLLCFPIESILWCGLAALAGASLPIPAALQRAKEDEDVSQR